MFGVKSLALKDILLVKFFVQYFQKKKNQRHPFPNKLKSLVRVLCVHVFFFCGGGWNYAKCQPWTKLYAETNVFLNGKFEVYNSRFSFFVS